MNMIMIDTFTKRLALSLFIGLFVISTGHAEPYMGLSSATLGTIDGIGKVISKHSGKKWRKFGNSLQATSKKLAAEKARERRNWEREQTRQKHIEAIERQRQAWLAMTPEQRAEYQARKRRNDAIMLGVIGGALGALFNASSSGNAPSSSSEQPQWQEHYDALRLQGKGPFAK